MLSTDPAVRTAYAADASGLILTPDAVARPSNAAEVVELMQRAAADGTAVTAAGGQSSMTGGSITDNGILLSLRGMDRIIDLDPLARTVRVEPGIMVGDLKRRLAAEGFLFAPDPTSEEEAALGGAIACNASGARSLRYGATRRHVTGLTVVLANGELVELTRPALEKNTVGYAPVHDPVDWFIGSEGTLGIVVAAELALLPLPERVTGLGIPFDDEADALRFVVAAREAMRLGTIAPRCLEILDARALELVRAGEGGGEWRGAAFVYTEEEHAGDRDLDFAAWLALAERHRAGTDDILVFDDDAKIRTARLLRHDVPATMAERGNAFAPAGGRRVGTDWAVPYPRLAEAIGVAREAIRRHDLPLPVMYGHAGNGHPHMDFVAHDTAELHRVEAAIRETLERILGMGGTVAAEHGIGKIKRQWLPLQLSPLQLAAQRALKAALDPEGRLAPGNVLE
ncbi:MAG: FAD-binding oxidoreductase [Gemmatimonadales bacterium]|nr:FAD-binding oxidoreductase [Gemmatimonadales bacterium]MDZ4388927.1 FAD-binding oxidoreductase [Gemmatimonadales bacterium]